MTTRTPTTHHDARPQLRVLEGGLSPSAWQEDDPALAWNPERLREEMAAAALLADLLEQDGLRITFDQDPAGGRVRAHVMDDAGTSGRELSLTHVVTPTTIHSYTGAAG